MRKPARVFGYARVSSVEQAIGTSLQDQQNVIRTYAKGRGLDVTRMYVEAESAVHEKIERREQVRGLMAEVRTGDLVLVDKLDRWSRDPEFTYGSIRQILERGASFFAVGDNCDPSTRDGDTMLGVRILVAREEHKRIKERMVGTRRMLKSRGYYAEGLAPWGYRRQDVKGVDRNVLVIDEPEAERVREVFRRCIEGEPMMSIATEMHVKRDKVKDALHNRVYLGEVRDAVSGQWIKGHHPPIVTARVFLDAAASIDRRRYGARPAVKGSRTTDWWLRDVARCALCDAKMSAAYGGRGHGYFYCYARCTRRFVNVAAAEEQCEPMVLNRLIEIRDELAASEVTARRPRTDVESLRAKLQQKRLAYVDQFAEGNITREQLRERLTRIDEERTKLDAMAAEPEPVSPTQARSVLREIATLRKAWASMNTARRRGAIAFLARAVRLAADRKPTIDWYSGEDLARKR